MCVCLSTIVSSELHVRSSPKFVCLLPVAVARLSSGGVVIRYVLPVLWMTSYLLTSQGCSTSPPSCVRSLELGYKLCAVIPVASQRTQGTTFRALEVASQVASPGAESAVYDCLVLWVETMRVLRVGDAGHRRGGANAACYVTNSMRMILEIWLQKLCSC